MELRSLLADLGLVVITAAFDDDGRLRAVTWVCLADADGEPAWRVLTHPHRTDDAVLLVERHGLIVERLRTGEYDRDLAAVGIRVERGRVVDSSVDKWERRTA